MLLKVLSGVIGLMAAAAAAVGQNYVYDSAASATFHGSAAARGPGEFRLVGSGPEDAGAVELKLAAGHVRAFLASFDYRWSAGAGSRGSGEGIAFYLGEVLPPFPGISPPVWNEFGSGGDLVVSFDMEDFNGDGTPGDAGIRVRMDMNTVHEVALPAQLTATLANTWQPVNIHLTADKVLWVSFAGATRIHGLPLNFAGSNKQKFCLTGRGGTQFYGDQSIRDLLVSPWYSADFCASPTAIAGDGIINFDLEDASNENIPACQGTAKDVWWCWKAPVTGVATMSTQSPLALDTVLSVFDGCAPCGGASPLLACNDDHAGSLFSTLSVPVIGGATYSIRIGVAGASPVGIGWLSVVTTPTPTCAADFNQSGTVTVQDIFDFLAEFFAGCA